MLVLERDFPGLRPIEGRIPFGVGGLGDRMVYDLNAGGRERLELDLVEMPRLHRLSYLIRSRGSCSARSHLEAWAPERETKARGWPTKHPCPQIPQR
jgi:hypothetical protein